jgi:OTU-like cysteine protease
VEGKGNCCFDSIAIGLTHLGIQKHHIQVRKEIMDHIDSNKEWYVANDHFVFLGNNDRSEMVEEYIARLHTPGQWGSHLEVFAAAHIYGYVF